MPSRNQLIGLLHQAAKRAGLDDDTYRDRLERITGKRSAKNCSDEQLSLALNSFHVKQSVSHSHHGKIKALFIAAYNLGVFEIGTDKALDAFVKRQTGKERLSFVTPSEAPSVVEALIGMLAREGFVVTNVDDGGMTARRDLLCAQWAKLYRLKAVQTDYPSALWHYASRMLATNHAGLESLGRADLDMVARRLGSWVRKTQAGNAARKASAA
jgi:phage gp16-like protein